MSLDEIIRDMVREHVTRSLRAQHARVSKANIDEIVDFKMRQLAQNLVANNYPD